MLTKLLKNKGLYADESGASFWGSAQEAGVHRPAGSVNGG